MKKENRGGAREGNGRKRIEKEPQKARNVSLSDNCIEKAKKIGGGKNHSKGIRIAVEDYPLGCEKIGAFGKVFSVTQRYIRPGVDGNIYQSDHIETPDDEWEKCDEIIND